MESVSFKCKSKDCSFNMQFSTNNILYWQKALQQMHIKNGCGGELELIYHEKINR